MSENLLSEQYDDDDDDVGLFLFHFISSSTTVAKTKEKLKRCKKGKTNNKKTTLCLYQISNVRIVQTFFMRWA